MAIQDTATLYAPLTRTLELTSGTGDPSFTRATTATVFDNEGRLITVPSGAARFSGARFVHNRLDESHDLTNSWADSFSNLTVTPGQTDPDGGTGANHIAITASSNALLRDTPGVTLTRTNLVVAIAIWFKAGITDHNRWWRIQASSGNEASKVRMWFDTTNGVVGVSDVTGGWTVTEASVTAHPTTADWYKCVLRGVADPSEIGQAIQFQLWAQDGDNSTNEVGIAGGTGLFYAPQFHVMSGASSAALPEYVSIGELSAPYHGAGIDGAKYFDTDASGTDIPSDSLHGLLLEKDASTNSCLQARDLANASWTKTNTTATRNATGLDNIANTATTLEATSDDGTCLQSITLASAARSFSAYVKRVSGTGTIEITRDNGSSWTDVTSLIGSSSFTRVAIKGTSVLNPTVGFRLGTSGDSIAVDYCQDEAGSVLTYPIDTTTTAVTRNAEVMSYQTTSNISDTAGAIAARVFKNDWTSASGSIGSATTGLTLSASNAGVQAKDGTNTVNGPAGTPDNTERLAIGWETTNLKAASGGDIGTPGTYDGGLNLTVILLDVTGNVCDLYTWTTALSDAELEEASGGSTKTFHLLLLGVG